MSAAEISFPYIRNREYEGLSDIDFGRRCVEMATRAGDEKALGLAVEAVARAAVAEVVARLTVAFASSSELREIMATVAGNGRRGPP